MAHTLAEEEELAEADLLAETGTCLAADHHRLDLGQVTFLIVREAGEELFASDEAQDAVAKKLQSFVRCRAAIRAGGVGQRGAEEFRPGEPVADRGLTFFENRAFARFGGGIRGRHKTRAGQRSSQIRVTDV